MTRHDQMPPRCYFLDGSARRFGSTLVAGSPLKLFRLTEGGSAVVDRIEAAQPVEGSPLIERLLDAGAIHPFAGDPSFTTDDVTIVVPVFGRPGTIPDAAVIVDDGSQPPVIGAIIRLDTNQGPAAARNSGLTVVATPLVAFVDADVDLPNDWLEPLLGHFADPRVALVAPRVVSPGGSGALERYERDRGPLDMGAAPARVRAGTRVSYVPTAAVVCRTEAVRALGGFDPDLRFGEDVDLVWRLDDAGWRCRYEPGVVVRHAPRRDWWSWVRQRIDYGSSAAPLARRHRGKLAPLRMSPWSIGSWLLAITGRPVAGAVVGVGSAAALIPKLPSIPAGAAFRLAAAGNLHAGFQIAHAVRRVWFPLVAVAALRSRVARRVLVASAVTVGHPLELADDIAYCAGVWKGMFAERMLDPILPEIASWPGRSH